MGIVSPGGSIEGTMVVDEDVEVVLAMLAVVCVVVSWVVLVASW